MQRQVYLAITAIVAVALLAGMSPARAQAVEPSAGTPGAIPKFVTSTTLGNSVLREANGNIGLGTTAPISKLDIRATGALTMWAIRPYMMFRDSSAGNARHILRSSSGGLTFEGESFLRRTNTSAFMRIDSEGRVGFGAPNPMRTIQIGDSPDAAFTIEPSSGSPIAGMIRFGDNTGWQFRIGRQRQSSGGALNQGFTGTLMTIVDDGAFHLNSGFPLGATGVTPICRTLSNALTFCQASSLRYKTDIAPYAGGLDMLERLRPIAFTYKHNGSASIGLAAEDVAAVEPRFIYRNDEDEVEGIRYELLGAVFINAIREQQTAIKQQEQQLTQQQRLIEELAAKVARLEQASRP